MNDIVVVQRSRKVIQLADGRLVTIAAQKTSRIDAPVKGGRSRRSTGVPQPVHRFFARYAQGPIMRG